MSRSPSNIAVKGDFQWLVDLALNLQLLEVFDTLGRRLNLFKTMGSELDSNGKGDVP
jgi:hypothetical protein